MLGVCLRKLCPQDSFGFAFREKKTVPKKPARGGSKKASGKPPDGSFVPVGPNLAAKAARRPCLGRSGGALGAILGPCWTRLAKKLKKLKKNLEFQANLKPNGNKNH